MFADCRRSTVGGLLIGSYSGAMSSVGGADWRLRGAERIDCGLRTADWFPIDYLLAVCLFGFLLLVCCWFVCLLFFFFVGCSCCLYLYCYLYYLSSLFGRISLSDASPLLLLSSVSLIGVCLSCLLYCWFLHVTICWKQKGLLRYASLLVYLVCF